MRRYHFKSSATAFLLLPIMLSIVLGIGMFAVNRSVRSHFDAVKWKRVRLDSEDTARLDMLDDFLRRYRLVGLNEERVIQLLGPEGGKGTAKIDTLDYWLGREPGPFSIDNVYLSVRIKDGKVLSYEIIRD